MKNKRKIIKKFPKARLESCGTKERRYGGYISRSHKNGCYLKLTNEEVDHSMSTDDDIFIPKKQQWKYGLDMVVLDFNKKDELVGIEFVEGLPYKLKKK